MQVILFLRKILVVYNRPDGYLMEVGRRQDNKFAPPMRTYIYDQ